MQRSEKRAGFIRSAVIQWVIVWAGEQKSGKRQEMKQNRWLRFGPTWALTTIGTVKFILTQVRRMKGIPPVLPSQFSS